MNRERDFIELDNETKATRQQAERVKVLEEEEVDLALILQQQLSGTLSDSHRLMKLEPVSSSVSDLVSENGEKNVERSFGQSR